MLAPREIDKMMIWTAAKIADDRKKRGIKLNYPESFAYIANHAVEGFRLNIPAGPSVRFEPGDSKEVELCELG